MSTASTQPGLLLAAVRMLRACEPGLSDQTSDPLSVAYRELWDAVAVVNSPHAPEPWWSRVSPAIVEAYLDLVRETRITQRIGRDTPGALFAEHLVDLETRVDRVTAELSAAIAAGRPAAAVVEEGGAR